MFSSSTASGSPSPLEKAIVRRSVNMALINCSECKREISDKAKSCPHCGCPIKVEGKGFGTTSLVLGIISCVYSLPAAITALLESPDNNASILLIAYIMIIAILSLVFGLISHKMGCKLGRKTAGLVLSIISLTILTISMIFAIL